MGIVSVYGYGSDMPSPRPRIQPPQKPFFGPRKRRYSNRIAELTRLNDLTYAEVGDKVGAHEITIAKLAGGTQKLTTDWMERLGDVFGVHPSEIKWPPPAKGLRRVKVKGAIQAGVWSENHQWEDEQGYSVMIPDDPALKNRQLYGAEISGDSMNLRYPSGSVVVLSPVLDGGPSEIREGSRYHVRQTRRDGLVEETIKTLVRGPDGAYWLKPESSSPEFQTWIPLDGGDGVTVELVGRVRFVVQRED